MYLPKPFEVRDRDQILAGLRRVGFGHLVTSSATEAGLSANLDATAVPFLIDDELTTARAHLARGNRQWRAMDGATALLIVPGADTYISPRWYRSKAEHGKVVPTWNYEVIHLHGIVTVHDDREWTLNLVSELTDGHEATVAAPPETEPWKVSDAPPAFTSAQLKAIVGIQLNVTGIDAKRKLSQNRPVADRAGVIEGLARSVSGRDRDVAAAMDRD